MCICGVVKMRLRVYLSGYLSLCVSAQKHVYLCMFIFMYGSICRIFVSLYASEFIWNECVRVCMLVCICDRINQSICICLCGILEVHSIQLNRTKKTLFFFHFSFSSSFQQFFRHDFFFLSKKKLVDCF